MYINIRNKDGYLTSKVSQSMARRLIRSYLGEWGTRNGEQVYTFRESFCFGDGEIAIVCFPGSFVEIH